MLRYLFYLGILNIAFGLLWKWIIILPITLIQTLLKTDRGLLLFKIVGAYLLVACTALLTTAMIDSPFSSVAYPIIGGFVLFMSFASNANEARKLAYQNFDFQMMSAIRYDSFIMFGSIILFVICYFIPELAANVVTIHIFKAIEWAYDLPVIGWILGIGGVLATLSMMWQGFFTFLFLVGSMFETLRGKSKQTP